MLGRHVIELRQRHSYPLHQIGNADETPVFWDIPSNMTVDNKGAKSISLRTTGNEKQRITVMLAVTADGGKLPPYVILKRKTMPKENLPKGLVIRCQEKGWMTTELMVDWLATVWNRRPGALLCKRAMLVLDAFKGHLTPEVKKKITALKTDLVVIPGDSIIKGFKKCCVSNALDGSEDDVLWAESDEQSDSDETNTGTGSSEVSSDIGEDVHDVIRLLIPALYKNQSDSLMAADGDCHHLCKLIAPVRHRWSINDVIGGIRNTVMPSDCSPVVVITEDVQNVHLLLEYRPHIDVSLTCEHDPKLQEYCAPETNKPMILNGPTSRNREGSDQRQSVEAKQLGHLYLSIDQETFDPSTGEAYD
ncbi:hypothetical protein ANN_27168 [Periplaneta americana]|uniref:DDE-1 domain-containing protein n=1 Tax=Periplaneta americana TaxID=6978 RepID=A0ABQ8RXF2_PERAM|nr:hypothetical protein ANN_27168 [Periplaneta americana]